MNTPPLSTPPPTASNDYLPTGGASPESPEEAAQAFEKVLVRRLVQTMTKNMFESGLSGDAGPGWMQGQRNQQRDLLTDVLADHIVDARTLGISDMLLRDWGLVPEESGTAFDEKEATPPATLPDRPRHIAAQTE